MVTCPVTATRNCWGCDHHCWHRRPSPGARRVTRRSTFRGEQLPMCDVKWGNRRYLSREREDGHADASVLDSPGCHPRAGRIGLGTREINCGGLDDLDPGLWLV